MAKLPHARKFNLPCKRDLDPYLGRHPVDGQIRSTLKGCTEGAGLRVGSKANFSIGERAAELKINRGPGYRICFGCDDEVLIILPGGGTKRRQQNDIDVALRRWRDYKKAKA